MVMVLMKFTLLGEGETNNKQRVCQIPISILKRIKQRKTIERAGAVSCK